MSNNINLILMFLDKYSYFNIHLQNKFRGNIIWKKLYKEILYKNIVLSNNVVTPTIVIRMGNLNIPVKLQPFTDKITN